MSVTTMCRLMLNLHGRAETGIHTTEYAISPHQQCTHGQGRTTGFRPYAQFTTRFDEGTEGAYSRSPFEGEGLERDSRDGDFDHDTLKGERGEIELGRVGR